MLSASVMYPIRGAVTWKSTAGTNVASDALANLSSGGVLGGALIILGEDYGEGSSIMQERSHAFAMKSQFWMLDPRPNLPSMVKAVEDGFELSEASHTPVMLRDTHPRLPRPRSVHGQVQQPPSFHAAGGRRKPEAGIGSDRAAACLRCCRSGRSSRALARGRRIHPGAQAQRTIRPPEGEVGIILQGGMYNSVLRALQFLGLADVYGVIADAALRDERHLPARR